MSQIPLSFATCSISSADPASNTLPKKLEAIASANFSAVELAFPDLQSFASQLLHRDVAADDYKDLCTAAREVALICHTLNLKVMMLQPFSNFEGWPRGSKEREDAFARAKGWIEIMEACGTDMLQVGSTDSPAEKMTTKREDIISDLRELADILRALNMRLAYENWCWSTHAPTWKDVWDIMREVDRPNIGLCLDTFQTAGSEWADPTNPSGLIENETEGGEVVGKDSLNRKFKQSLDDLAKTVPANKIYLLQISDAYKPEPSPLKKRDIDGMRPRAWWSHAFRPFPYQGGYLPVEDVTRAVLETGFRGWFSVEVFDAGPRGKGKVYDMREFAGEGKRSVDELIRRCTVG
ncbi:hypothetical protein AJ79_09530 [Helicocarpus griseus UAMH5409]|uniref:Xylose isomerase-like TIM barrel domain-containing protein n=1 Tax=Helicocarpus griseus UAMH5409 TaxID=1447875 RepID=A0A2B7WJ93_9EURO|nr:hypothetical protein AJ79_09530 [Helicocarpus griseus UAMH5409]